MTKSHQVQPEQPVVSQQPPPYVFGPSTSDTAPPRYNDAVAPAPVPVPGHQLALTVADASPVASQQAVYRHTPITVICHSCGAVVVTRTSPKMGVAVTGSIFCLIFFGCYLGCCLVPLCVRDMYDTVHTCPNCKIRVGIYEVVKF